MELDLTPEEIAEALRTWGALARARLSRDEEAVRNLLADAGQRELLAVLHAYMAAFGDLIVHLAAAVGFIEDDENRALAMDLDPDAMAAVPGMRAVLEQCIAAMQARVIGGEHLEPGE
jgi:hypothetical protein